MKNKFSINTRNMGFVFIGAFADLIEDLKKKKEDKKIGFNHRDNNNNTDIREITDEEYIQFGVIAEIVGRVSSKVVTRDLTDEDYINIIRNPHSRVSTMRRSLVMAGVAVPEITDEEIKELIGTTKKNKTGVRWVSAQIENKMLQNIRKTGIGKKKQQEETFKVSDLIKMVKQVQGELEEPDR
mgnify:CR=1 FL=1